MMELVSSCEEKKMSKDKIEKVKNDRWMNQEELEAEFGITVSTQSLKRKKKELPFSKLGGFIYYDRIKIDELLENHAVVEL